MEYITENMVEFVVKLINRGVRVELDCANPHVLVLRAEIPERAMRGLTLVERPKQ